MTAESGELTLEIRRVLPAAPSVVFGAFSAPDELAKWWVPEGFTAPSLQFNPEDGDWSSARLARACEAAQLGYSSGMSPMRRSRRAFPALAAAFVLGVAACGEDDAERAVDQGVDEAEQVGGDAEKAGEDAAGEAEKGAEEAERELEK
jgi:hypothetical protein